MASISPSAAPQAPADAAERSRRLSIGFINWAHAIDHFVMLILATVVIELATVYGRSYAELIALGTPSFIAFGVFSLPAGWLGDHWSRRNMMALFYFGCGGSLAAAAFAPNLVVLAIALTALGVFAAIYHPVGTAMLIEQATSRGRSLAFNGVCGNLGVALAAGMHGHAGLRFGWRGAYFMPAIVCLVAAFSIFSSCPTTGKRADKRASSPEVVLEPWLAAAIFALFVLIALSAGLVFHIVTMSLPKSWTSGWGSAYRWC